MVVEQTALLFYVPSSCESEPCCLELQADEQQDQPQCCGPVGAGRDAVRWLVHSARVAADATEAVAMGNAMMQLGLLHHVVSPAKRYITNGCMDGMCCAAFCCAPSAYRAVS